jgi:hypothetical protein
MLGVQGVRFKVQGSRVEEIPYGKLHGPMPCGYSHLDSIS